MQRKKTQCYTARYNAVFNDYYNFKVKPSPGFTVLIIAFFYQIHTNSLAMQGHTNVYIISIP